MGKIIRFEDIVKKEEQRQKKLETEVMKDLDIIAAALVRLGGDSKCQKMLDEVRKGVKQALKGKRRRHEKK